MIASASMTITNITDGITTFYQYAKNASNTVAPASGWNESMPASEAGKFIWRREGHALLISEVTDWGNEMCLTGATGGAGTPGAPGPAGPTGTGVSSITLEYYLSTSKTTQSGGSWSTTHPTWSSGKYLWTRYKIVYTNPTNTVYTTPLCDSSWEAVNGVRVGGVNLVLDSDKGWDSTSYNIMQGELSENWIEGETYTITIKGTVNSGQGIGLWRDTGSTTVSTSLPYISTEGVYRLTFVCPSTAQTDKYKFSLYNYPSATATEANVQWIKIERGNVATGWTASPKDELPPAISSSNNIITIIPGKILFNGSSSRVPYFSLALTNSGIGYVAFDGSSVSIVKMQPNSDSIRWVDYEVPATSVGEPYLIIGRFDKDGSTIANVEVIEPIPASTFPRTHFMEILARDSLGDVTQWGEALGVAQFFQSIATWELFANSIKANNLEISKMVGGQLFKLIMTRSEGDAPPVIQAWRGDTLVFEINSSEGRVFIKGGGEFQGKILHEALETNIYIPGDPVTVTNTKSLWSTTQLYNSLTTISQDSTIKSGSGSYAGKTINGLTRLSDSSKKAKISSYSQPTQYSGVSWKSYQSYLVGGVFTVPSGCNYITISAKGAVNRTQNDVWMYVGKNVTSNVYPSGPPTGANYNNAYLTQTILSNNTPIAYTQYIYPNFYTFSQSFSVSAGDKIYVGVTCQKHDDDPQTTYYVKDVIIEAYSSIVGPGVFFRNTDNTYGLIATNQYRNDVFTLTSPAWSSASNLVFKDGNDLLTNAKVATLQVGTMYTASGTATIQPAGETSVAYTIQGIRRNSSSVSLLTTAGEITVEKWPTQGSTIGVYSTITTSITLVGQERSITASSILPKNNGDGKDSFLIGSGSNKFTAGHFINLYATVFTGNVNAAGTGNKVYGAVFN